MLFEERGGYGSLMFVQPTCNLPPPAKTSPPSRTLVVNDKGIVNSSEVLEVMSPQVSLETMGLMVVEDLPRYHPLVEDFWEVANHWMAAGHLRGPANIRDGYMLELAFPYLMKRGISCWARWIRWRVTVRRRSCDHYSEARPLR